MNRPHLAAKRRASRCIDFDTRVKGALAYTILGEVLADSPWVRWVVACGMT